jgi:MoaA/NifB/PqqE/SkfB family radical SAM enzyme
MIAGKQTRDCIKCYQQEKNGIASLRSTNGIEDYVKNTKADGTYTKPANTMQIQMSNICNLKCKMCSQMYSHMIGLELLEIGKEDPDWLHWVKEQGANVNNWTNELGIKQEWYKNKEFKLQMFEHISQNITHLNVIGGEPTLIPEFYEMFEYCDKQNTLGNKAVTLVTNLTNTNPKMTKWLPKLKKWTIWASIDGVAERTEYIRYPSQWKIILKSLDFYKNLARESNGGITLSPAIQLLNVDQLDDIIKWWINWCGGELNETYEFTWLSVVWYPLICNPAIAPREWRLKVADKLDKFTFDSFYKKYITDLRNEKYSAEQMLNYQKSFIKYNDRQDQFRKGKTWRELLPELESALTISTN